MWQVGKVVSGNSNCNRMQVKFLTLVPHKVEKLQDRRNPSASACLPSVNFYDLLSPVNKETKKKSWNHEKKVQKIINITWDLTIDSVAISHVSPISASLHATSVLLDGTNTYAQNSAQCTLTQARTYFSFRCITCCNVFPAHATASRSNIFHVIYDLSRLFSLFLILFLFVFAQNFLHQSKNYFVSVLALNCHSSPSFIAVVNAAYYL